MSQNLQRKNKKKATSKTIQYVKGKKDKVVDLRKNWVQFNEQGLQALNLMVIRSRKTAEEDPLSYAIYQALETSEILLMSEYSYEMTFSQRFKSQDYDFFHELVGNEDQVPVVINLHRVFLSLVMSIKAELFEMTVDDQKLNEKLTKALETIRLRADQADLFDNLVLEGDLRK